MLSGTDAAKRGLQVDTTASAVVATLGRPDSAGRAHLRWSNAGHPPPLALAPDGRVDVLRADEADA